MNGLAGFPEEKARRLDELSGSLLKNWHARHSNVPRVLYHYTSAEGLLGILNSKSFWMTNLRYMNDFSELQYSHEMISSVLKQEGSIHKAGVLHEFFQRIGGAFDPFAGGLDVFATSFCENGNLLSQWRAYGDKGGGYAVGLDFFHLFSFIPQRCVLRKVIYRREDQIATVREIVVAFCESITEITEGQTVKEADSDNTLPSFCQLFHQLMSEYVFCFKHPDFEQEQEWRLVNWLEDSPPPSPERTNQLCFRSFGGNIIPYVTFTFKNAIQASIEDSYGVAFPIVELVIGPTLNPELNKQSIKSLLKQVHPDFSPSIKKSGIPLRWL